MPGHGSGGGPAVRYHASVEIARQTPTLVKLPDYIGLAYCIRPSRFPRAVPMPTLLDSLRRHTVIVADTGDLAAIGRLKPRDATTNPSLILKAAQTAEAEPLVRHALAAAAGEPVDRAIDRVLVAFGVEILKRIEGRVSTEVDAHQSFDTRATIERARRIVALYETAGVDRQRILIKIASTWEGIRAA